MNIHEYQAKALLREFGVPVSRGVAVLKASEAEAAAKTLDGPVWVVKSQIQPLVRGLCQFTRPPRMPFAIPSMLRRCFRWPNLAIFIAGL